jgi:undecaprenyl-diphosphatase
VTAVDNGANGHSWLSRMDRNARGAIATLLRPPRRQPAWPASSRIALGAALTVAVVLMAMLTIDAPVIAAMHHLPRRVIVAFDDFTDYGRSGVFLFPIGFVLLVLAALDTQAMPPFARRVLAAFAVRMGFVFTAIALPGLFSTIIKRIIGRARPWVPGSDVWTYHPFAWQAAYASLPSGHETTAFSALVAIGALIPQARALLWIYAVLIAVSRVALVAHYPSDVIAGAAVGTAGAALVRNWFAARGLAFAVGMDGVVRPMPGPSATRIAKAVAQRLLTA